MRLGQECHLICQLFRLTSMLLLRWSALSPGCVGVVRRGASRAATGASGWAASGCWPWMISKKKAQELIDEAVKEAEEAKQRVSVLPACFVRCRVSFQPVVHMLCLPACGKHCTGRLGAILAGPACHCRPLVCAICHRPVEGLSQPRVKGGRVCLCSS